MDQALGRGAAFLQNVQRLTKEQREKVVGLIKSRLTQNPQASSLPCSQSETECYPALQDSAIDT